MNLKKLAQWVEDSMFSLLFRSVVAPHLGVPFRLFQRVRVDRQAQQDNLLLFSTS